MSVSLARTLLNYLAQQEEWPPERRERLRATHDIAELRRIAREKHPFVHPLARKAIALLDEAAEQHRVAELIRRAAEAA